MASRGSSGTRGLHCRRCGIHAVTGRCFIQPLPLAGISDGPRAVFGITVLLSLAVLGSSACKTSDPRSGADHHAEALQPLLLVHACRFRGLGLLRGRRVSLAARLGWHLSRFSICDQGNGHRHRVADGAQILSRVVAPDHVASRANTGTSAGRPPR